MMIFTVNFRFIIFYKEDLIMRNFKFMQKNMIKLNKYVNVLEKFQKKYKIEYDTYLKAKFKKELKK